MKILLITKGVSRLVKPLFGSKHEIIGIIESMPRDYQENAKSNLVLNTVKAIYHKFKGQKQGLKFFCEKHGIPYNYICKGRDQVITQWVKGLNPDLVVVFSMSQLLKEELISVPKCGTINMHPSFLPEYRGANPDFWQYYNMEMNPGVTVHYVDKGEDTGDIIFQDRVHISLGTKSPERLDRLIGDVGVPLVLKAIKSIESGVAPRITQPLTSSTKRARNLKPEEHKSIIDWKNWPIERTWHVLRGTELWLNAIPQPKGIYSGQRWIVEEFERCVHGFTLGIPVKHQGRNAVAVSEGVIYIQRKFNVKNFVVNLLRAL